MASTEEVRAEKTRSAGRARTFWRRLRIFGKKRRNRRTGSHQWGTLSLGVFFAAFFLIGCVTLGSMLFTLSIPEWRANQNYARQDCTVLEKRVGELKRDEGPRYRPEVKIRFRVGDDVYTAWTYDAAWVYSGDKAAAQRALAAFQIGQEYPVWFDPQNPGRNPVIVRGFNWYAWLGLLLPGTFIVLGGVGSAYTVLNWGQSVERLAIRAQRRGPLDELNAASRKPRRFPYVPDDAHVRDSAGTTLAYRLPSFAVSWRLLGMLAACLIWNGTVATLITVAIRGHWQPTSDRSEWLFTLAVVPFMAVGIVLIAALVRQLMIAAVIGATFLEISDHPLQIGQTYELLVSKSGRLSVRLLRVMLVCEEEATFRQGTNTRTSCRRVYEKELIRSEGFSIALGEVWQSRAQLSIPTTAMHAFKADYNQIQWKIVVYGNVDRWPNFERNYSVVVNPPYPERNR